MSARAANVKKKHKLLWFLAVGLALVGLGVIYYFNAPRPDLNSLKIRRNIAAVDQATTKKQLLPTVVAKTPNWRFGIVTGSSFQGSDSLLGVAEAIKLYGDARQGGLIKNLTYPDNFLAKIDATMATIESLAADPLVKVILVLEGVPGTAEAFKRIREKRPDVTLLVAESHEDSEFIASAADLVVNVDFIARGYLLPLAAQKVGAKTLVHVSFPRHMIDESINRSRDIMELACEDLGLAFAFENAPDPTAQSGLKFAQDFILERIPLWLEKYGPDTAFYTTNNAHVAPLIKGVIDYGGYFVQAGGPSPLLGFPEALGLNFDSSPLDFDLALKEIDSEVTKRGGAGRLGTWPVSLSYCHVLALVEFGRLVVEGQVDKRDVSALLKIYERVAPKVKWRGGLYADEALRPLKNVYLIYQDVYVFGQGFLGLTKVPVPIRYKTARKNLRPELAQAAFHIGLITGEDDQGAEDLIVAKAMINRYGDVKDGGIIRHEVYLSQYFSDESAVANLIEKMADDPLLRAIVVNQAIPGTAEGFRRVKLKRPDIFCLAGEPFESPAVISANADLAVAADFVARGYLIPYQAKILGAKTLVHVSFPRHLSYETLKTQKRVMEAACRDLGLNFVMETALDPLGEAGVAAAQQFIVDDYPKWLDKYGQDTAFYVTNDALTEPLLKQLAKLGGYFIEADIPSPLLGYPGAFNLDLSDRLDQWHDILAIVEKAVVEAGGGGRMGVWAYPLGYTETAGLVEFGKLLAEGRVLVSDINAFLKCLGLYTPGARWSGSFLNDPITGKPLRNYFLIYEDTYIFGRGYIETTKVDIPEKFYAIK
ncbi:MAG: DUF3798 domain-containing protein [Deltaproteobacteria bacterium]|jgi:hypothetical protein|nr:DUF3798 domain-containing protein [Deltaproteobacteria bacterium]